MDFSCLVHHGELEDEALCTGQWQELRVRGGESLPPSALERHGSYKHQLSKCWATLVLRRALWTPTC